MCDASSFGRATASRFTNICGTGKPFISDGARRAFALDANTGAVLWELPLNSSIGGFPMTFMVDGTQYLAIPTGSSILPQFSAPLTPESIAPADRVQGKGSTLMVFKLANAE